MKIIKLIQLILLKLIIRLDEALIEAKPNQDERNEANKAIFNANRQADRATNVDALNKYKAVTGQAKAKLADRRANKATKADTRRGERKAKIENKREAKCRNQNENIRGNQNKGRGENKSGNVRGNDEQATIRNKNNDIKRKLEKVEGRIILGYGR